MIIILGNNQINKELDKGPSISLNDTQNNIHSTIDNIELNEATKLDIEN